jgi:hypothetical protein
LGADQQLPASEQKHWLRANRYEGCAS